MKEDILEQLVDDYLQAKGYFTRHNLKFRPEKNHADYNSKKDSSHSDIDVIGINPLLSGPERVYVVTCKSWQAGFDPKKWIDCINNKKIVSGREAWKFFRELIEEKWSEALMQEVKKVTGAESFTYVTAVTHLRGNGYIWTNHEPFIKALKGNPIKILPFKDMIAYVHNNIGTTLTNSQLTRTIQLIKASGYNAA
jgi:hypothetical protein